MLGAFERSLNGMLQLSNDLAEAFDDLQTLEPGAHAPGLLRLVASDGTLVYIDRWMAAARIPFLRALLHFEQSSSALNVRCADRGALEDSAGAAAGSAAGSVDGGAPGDAAGSIADVVRSSAGLSAAGANDTREVVLPELGGDALRRLLRFAYCGRLELTRTCALDALVGARYLALGDAAALCEEYIGERLGVEAHAPVVRSARSPALSPAVPPAVPPAQTGWAAGRCR